MSAVAQTWVLTKREFMQRVKSRAFQVMMLVTVVAILALIPLLSLAVRNAPPMEIGITADVVEPTEADLHKRASELDTAINVTRYQDTAAAEDALRSGDVDVVLASDEIIWLEDESVRARAVITAAVATAAFREAAVQIGMPEEDLAALISAAPLPERTVLTPDPEAEPRRIGAFVGLILLYMSILIFAQFVAMGVMEEKQNRVVEVVLSRVRSTQVLVSKVVGIGSLGLLQLLIVGLAMWLAVSLVDVADVSLGAIGAEILAWIVFWYLLGYALYAVIYAALGATITRQEDLQGVLLLPVIALVPGFFLAQMAQEFTDMPLVVIGSFFPLWSPMVMPVRAAVGDVAFWEIALSVALVLVSVAGLIRLGARIYTGAILHFGAKVRLRDAWRSSNRHAD